jgi:hypothetical protein
LLLDVRQFNDAPAGYQIRGPRILERLDHTYMVLLYRYSSPQALATYEWRAKRWRRKIRRGLGLAGAGRGSVPTDV